MQTRDALGVAYRAVRVGPVVVRGAVLGDDQRYGGELAAEPHQQVVQAAGGTDQPMAVCPPGGGGLRRVGRTRLGLAEADSTGQGDRTALCALLERCPDVDAVFAASDVMAAGALAVLRKAGRPGSAGRGTGRLRGLRHSAAHRSAADQRAAVHAGDGAHAGPPAAGGDRNPVVLAAP